MALPGEARPAPAMAPATMPMTMPATCTSSVAPRAMPRTPKLRSRGRAPNGGYPFVCRLDAALGLAARKGGPGPRDALNQGGEVFRRHAQGRGGGGRSPTTPTTPFREQQPRLKPLGGHPRLKDGKGKGAVAGG